MTGPSLRAARWLAVGTAAAVAVATGFVLVGSGGPGGAAAAPDLNPDTVSVTGVGTADGAPDTLTADFSVHVTRSTVQAALDAQAAAARRLLAALQRSGVPRNQLRTTELSLDRHYDNHGTVTGYDASETVHARISPLARAGRTISTAATSSGNDVEVGSLGFDISADSALVDTARANAFADARSRAEQYAGLSHRGLGRVEHISERVEQPPPTPVYYGAALDSAGGPAASVPIRGGQQTLTVHVAVVWALS